MHAPVCDCPQGVGPRKAPQPSTFFQETLDLQGRFWLAERRQGQRLEYLDRVTPARFEQGDLSGSLLASSEREGIRVS